MCCHAGASAAPGPPGQQEPSTHKTCTLHMGRQAPSKQQRTCATSVDSSTVSQLRKKYPPCRSPPIRSAVQSREGKQREGELALQRMWTRDATATCVVTTARRPARAGNDRIVHELQSSYLRCTANLSISSNQSKLQVHSQMMAMNSDGIVRSLGMSEAVRAR